MGLVELSLNHSTNLTPSSGSDSRLIGQLRLHGIDAVSPTIADTLSHGPEREKLVISREKGFMAQLIVRSVRPSRRFAGPFGSFGTAKAVVQWKKEVALMQLSPFIYNYDHWRMEGYRFKFCPQIKFMNFHSY